MHTIHMDSKVRQIILVSCTKTLGHINSTTSMTQIFSKVRANMLIKTVGKTRTSPTNRCSTTASMAEHTVNFETNNNIEKSKGKITIRE